MLTTRQITNRVNSGNKNPFTAKEIDKLSKITIVDWIVMGDGNRFYLAHKVCKLIRPVANDKQKKRIDLLLSDIKIARKNNPRTKWDGLPSNIKKALSELHSHAQLEYEVNTDQIVYTEDSVIKLIKKFAHPKWFQNKAKI